MELLSDIELDTLREVMNMGFGQAMGELSEVINMHIHLSIPEVAVWSAEEAPGLMDALADKSGSFSVVEQYYIGKLSGIALFLLPEGGNGMLEILSGKGCTLSNGELYGVEKDATLEISNIVISACVGKIAELLGDNVLYKPPRFLRNELGSSRPGSLFSESYFMLYMKTSFGLEARETSGTLLLILDIGSIDWIKQALARIMRSFMQ